MRDRSHLDTALGPDIRAFLDWRTIGNTAPRTLDANERTLAVGARMYPRLRFEDWTAVELAAVVATMPAKSRRVRVSCWRTFFHWGIVYDRRLDNPCDKLPKLRRTPLPVVHTFTDTEILRLTTIVSAANRPLTRLLLDTGIRMEEARRLRVRDYLVDPAPGFVHVTGKGAKDRLIPCTRAVAQGLNELILGEALGPSDHFWYSRKGNQSMATERRRDRPIGQTTFDRWWREMLEAAGVAHRGVHTCRHTFATRYLSHRRGKIERLRELMGHESIETTRRYVHNSPTELARDFELIMGGAA